MESLMTRTDDAAAQADTKDREIVSTRVFDANIDLVWQAWSKPDHIRLWWGPNGFTNTFQHFDFRVGGHWRFTMHGPDGANYENEIVFLEIAPRERLVLDHVSPPRFRISVTFESLGAKTRVVFRQLFETVETYRKVKPLAEPGNEQNFDRFAARLREMGGGRGSLAE